MSNLVAIIGSLRKQSFNRALFQACSELLPEGASLVEAPISELPLFNADLTGENQPAPVARFRKQIQGAHGVLFITPEYNHGIPGVLANAIDWGSRPAFKSPFHKKPVAMMSATPGPVGGARGQISLATVLLGMACHVFPHPGFCLGGAASQFDEQLRLSNEKTRTFAQDFLQGFVHFTKQLD